MSTPSRGLRKPWTLQQQQRMEQLIEEHERLGARGVPWGKYAAELGHALTACYTEAAQARRRLATRRRAEYRRQVQAALAEISGLGVTDDRPSNPSGGLNQTNPLSQRELPRIGLDHMICTSTAKLRMAHDIENRLSGIFGGPPPGRSALDEKMGTAIVPPPTPRKPGERVPRTPTLATRPVRF